MKSALSDLRGKENEVQALRAKVTELKVENEQLKAENEQLRLQLQRYELERNYTGANNCKGKKTLKSS